MTPELSSADLLRVMRAREARVSSVGAPAGLPLSSPSPEGEGFENVFERCGLLLGRRERVTCVEEARNVSPSPHDSFEIEPAALLRAHRQARTPSGLALIGYWHTHPRGEATPSPRDAERAAPDGRLWLIATAARATLWRAVADGRVHGRFDPVRFDLRDGKRIDRGVAGVQMRGAGDAFTMFFGEPPS